MPAIRIETAKRVTPQCYAYTLPGVPEKAGQTKIGFTERDVKTRIKEQTHTAGITPNICWARLAKFNTEPYDSFTDRDFHAYLKKLGVRREVGTEWFEISPESAENNFRDFTENHGNVQGKADSVIPYVLREEQAAAVARTKAYFETRKNAEFLWNAKPRFGKTLSAYDLCKKLGATKVLIVTNRPAIANSWYQDYETFFGPQSGMLFVSTVEGIKDKKFVYSQGEFLDRAKDPGAEFPVRGCIEFVSLQDLKGSIYLGGNFEKLKECSEIEWDLLIIDEAHEGVDTYKTDNAFGQIRRKHTLHLSGTPFKAIANEKFAAEAIFNWTYADEQAKKRDWDCSCETENPYAQLPTLSLFTYQMSDIVREKVRAGIQLADNEVEEFAFDLNEFFATNDSGKFVHEKEVDKFLDALTTGEKFPFSTPELRSELKHSFWMLNRVASAKALAKKLKDHPVFKDYFVVLAAGDGKLEDESENEKSFDRVRKAIESNVKTITLSVGQLTTGVTIPEWTAVLMLSNMSSASLYMQAAFRAQNPCLFTDDEGNSFRKENAYVFDFDPARTLKIFEQFANDLIPDTAGEKGSTDSRKNHVRELLNFFPVYGEDDLGEMVSLDAEAVLTIPRHIHAKEVVERGFMSNFLFANISGIFCAPKEIVDLISGMQAIEEPKKLGPVGITETTAGELHLNEKGEVKISEEVVIGREKEIFGAKAYGKIGEGLGEALKKAKAEHEKDPEKETLAELKKKFAQPVVDVMMAKVKESCGQDIRKSTEIRIQKKIQDEAGRIAETEHGKCDIKQKLLEENRKKAVAEAQARYAPMSEITEINEKFDEERKRNHDEMLESIPKKLQDKETLEKVGKEVARIIDSDNLEAEKESIESDVRDHLRGFSRTIPAFLMAYGDETTTLANFDKLVPENVFWEVTANPQTNVGVTMEQFRLLRDGGDYYEKDSDGNEIRDDAHKKHFDGKLFDEVVFNDAVQEFMKKRRELANYFDPESKEDIFDYIPPQRTNQIFTPKKVVKDMVDRLEKENPGCFDDPQATFADLYMKSGMYVTEIVTRLYRSERIKALYPNDAERLKHIFAEQVYGLAPTEIIYRICLAYILGFREEIQIEKHNIRLFDSLECAKKGTLEEKLGELFPELKKDV